MLIFDGIFIYAMYVKNKFHKIKTLKLMKYNSFNVSSAEALFFLHPALLQRNKLLY